MDRSAATSDRSHHVQFTPDPSSGPRVRRVFTSAGDGDFAVHSAADGLGRRRATVAPYPWTWLQQVHGDRVVVVGVPGQHAGAEADAAVTDVPGAVLAVQTADCAGVLLSGIRPCAHGAAGAARGADGASVAVIGAAHAGWRGLADGVLQRTVQQMQALGGVDITWQLGPCISPAAYEFGAVDLAELVGRYDDSLRGTTAEGRPALDLRAGVRAALGETDAIEASDDAVACTATEPGFYSWRARRDTARQSAVTWIEPA